MLVGEDPTVVSVKKVPFGISDFRYGHEFGCRSSTFIPPASQTIVTTSFGCFVETGHDRLVHRLTVGSRVAVERQDVGHGGRDPGDRHRAVDLALRPDEAGAVPEHRHVLDVVPRPDVRQPGADEVRLLRDEAQLGAAVGAPAAPGPQQVLVRHRARDLRPDPGPSEAARAGADGRFSEAVARAARTSVGAMSRRREVMVAIGNTTTGRIDNPGGSVDACPPAVG